MTEREQLLNRVRMYDFALIDVGLYLDAYPNDASALSYFKQVRAMADEARAAYESQYGPLSPRNVESDTEWTWIADPWPWEGADN